MLKNGTSWHHGHYIYKSTRDQKSTMVIIEENDTASLRYHGLIC